MSTTLEHEVEHEEHGNSHGDRCTATSDRMISPLPTTYGYSYDGIQWIRTTRKFGDIGSETDGFPFSEETENHKFRDNQSVRAGKYKTTTHR
ncbi:hypothetical protein J4206_03175 [Candidatus Woesearchaeota archaeon]|nr:hypothetical protein [Candidatus Woesearchaeota archaeon]